MKLLILALALALLIGFSGAAEYKLNVSQIDFSNGIPGYIQNATGGYNWILYDDGTHVYVFDEDGDTAYVGTTVTNGVDALEYIQDHTDVLTSGYTYNYDKNRVAIKGRIPIDRTFNLTKPINFMGGELYQEGPHGIIYVNNSTLTEKLEGFGFSDVVFTENSSCGRTTEYLINLSRTSDITFDRCTIMCTVATAAYKLAVNLEEVAWWTRFESCHILGKINLDTATDNFFTDCWINALNTAPPGIYISSGSMNNHWYQCHFVVPAGVAYGNTIYSSCITIAGWKNHVANCQFDGGGQAVSGPSILISGGYLNTIEENSFTYNHVGAISLDDATYNSISRNVIWNSNDIDSASAFNIQLIGDSLNNTVANNIHYSTIAVSTGTNRTQKARAVYETVYSGTPDYNRILYDNAKTDYVDIALKTGAHSEVVV